MKVLTEDFHYSLFCCLLQFVFQLRCLEKAQMVDLHIVYCIYVLLFS